MRSLVSLLASSNPPATEPLLPPPSDKHKTVGQGETVVVPTKSTLEYAPLSRALEHKFGHLKKRELKRTGTVLWGLLGACAQPHSCPCALSN